MVEISKASFWMEIHLTTSNSGHLSRNITSQDLILHPVEYNRTVLNNLLEDPPNKSVLTERRFHSWNHSSDLEYTSSFWGVCPAYIIWTHHRLGAEMKVTEDGNDESGAILVTIMMNRPSGDEWWSQPAEPVGQGGATAARTPGTGSPKQRLFSGGIRQPLRSSGLRWQSASAHPIRSAWGPGRD